MIRAALAGALAAAVAAAPASATGPVLRVVEPSAGHITIEAALFTLSGRSTRPPPVVFPGVRSVTAPVQVVYAIRAKPGRHATRYALMIVAMRRPGASRRIAAAPVARTAQGPARIGLQWGHDPSQISCPRPRCTKPVEAAVVNADEGLSDADQLRRTVREGFSVKGETGAIFGGPGLAEPGPKLAVGRFDGGGPRFGWSGGPQQLRPFERHIADAALRKDAKELLPAVEAHTGVDVDGNGSTIDVRCTQTSIPFMVTVTDPPHGQVAYYMAPTNIPMQAWYVRTYGIGTAGCNRGTTMLANVAVQTATTGGKLISWGYDFGPFPANQGQPDAIHSGTSCPKTTTNPDGSSETFDECEIGVPTLGIGPDDQGHIGSNWPQDPAKHQYFDIVFGVEDRFGDAGVPPASVYAAVTSKPKR